MVVFLAFGVAALVLGGVVSGGLDARWTDTGGEATHQFA